LIDLHTHTNVSDGLSSPSELVTRAAEAGVTILSVTDHDTVAGYDEAARAADASGMTLVSGIEITAIADGIDVHVLGYFIDTSSASLTSLLAGQRRSRFERVERIVARLAAQGMPLEAERILQPAVDDPGKTPGRPWVARAMVARGYVATTDEAFHLWLTRGRPAFVGRLGPEPAAVISRIHEAGGIASLAHPGLLQQDASLPQWVDQGLDALEAYHSEHDDATTRHYLKVAETLGIAVSGGSDYHGGGTHGAGSPGSTSLPNDRYEELCSRRLARHR